MPTLFKVFSGVIPSYVRYCEVDGYVVDRYARETELHENVIREVIALRGFSSGF